MIGKKAILAVLVACGLLLVAPAANARGSDGKCTSIAARVIGAYNQIVNGINMVNNCNAVAASVVEFEAASCEDADLAFTNVLANGASCNLAATVCDAFEMCFAMQPDFCAVVPACTIP